MNKWTPPPKKHQRGERKDTGYQPKEKQSVAHRISNFPLPVDKHQIMASHKNNYAPTILFLLCSRRPKICFLISTYELDPIYK